jgi:phosphoglycolate phosphatase-like HAD superfamily hydrolase
MTQSLSSWEDTSTRQTILDFVANVTASGSEGFVASAERIATFDNDGTLWCEQPLAQGVFISDRLMKMATSDPSLRQTQPWKAIWDGDSSWINNAVTKHYTGDDTDLKALLGGALKGFGAITVEDFEAQAAKFYDTAMHPVYKQPYQTLGYVPMVELLSYLDANGFSCYIVSGGGRDFMRPVALSMYGLPPERIVGSTSGLTFKTDNSGANVMRTAALGILDDGPGKPIQIWERVGQRPILAAGNANGDIPMLQYASDQKHPTLCLLIHHDDSEREVKYNAGADKAVKTAKTDGWTVISMKNDWKQVFSFQ